jgi:hypothetical protein
MPQGVGSATSRGSSQVRARTTLYYEPMLRGSKPGIVKRIQPVSIHGQVSLDVYFADEDDPDGQVSLARIGPESVPRNLEAGDHVQLHYVLGVVTTITKTAGR